MEVTMLRRVVGRGTVAAGTGDGQLLLLDPRSSYKVAASVMSRAHQRRMFTVAAAEQTWHTIFLIARPCATMHKRRRSDVAWIAEQQ